MNRFAFKKLCDMLQSIGNLKPTKNVDLDEHIAIFLHILVHHVKNRVIKHRFGRSRESVSRYFNNVLHSIIILQSEFLKKPEPTLVDSRDGKLKWFKVLSLLCDFNILVRKEN